MRICEGEILWDIKRPVVWHWLCAPPPACQREALHREENFAAAGVRISHGTRRPKSCRRDKCACDKYCMSNGTTVPLQKKKGS